MLAQRVTIIDVFSIYSNGKRGQVKNLEQSLTDKYSYALHNSYIILRQNKKGLGVKHSQALGESQVLAATGQAHPARGAREHGALAQQQTQGIMTMFIMFI